MIIAKPYLLFLGDAKDSLAAKTAQGIADWRADWCVGQLRLAGCKADLGLDDLTLQDAKDRGAKTLVIGVVNPGGVLPAPWLAILAQAVEMGFDLASGLHQPLEDVPQLAQARQQSNAQFHNVRLPHQSFDTGKGTKRPGKRILTVGTDCSIGKKYTALALERDMRTRGMDADFRATGQTGILIAERGVALDAVASDFISGAAEWLTPDADADHWDIVEGQGSLFHPSFAGVSLGLLHGAQPDYFVVCHALGRDAMRGVQTPLPTIEAVIAATVSLGQLTNPAIAPLGLSLNTQTMAEADARDALKVLEDRHGLPATDPMRFGTQNLIDRCQPS